MQYDAVIIGAGACGLMCAVQAGYRGKRVLLIDANKTAGAKILISGGGRCNYTNLHCDAKHFITENTDFHRYTLSRWTVKDTINFFENKGIFGEEKTLGQLFPKSGKAKDVVNVFLDLLKELKQDVWLETIAKDIQQLEDGSFLIHYQRRQINGSIQTPSVVLASGGLPVAKLGSSDFALRVARKFGLRIVKTAPALVPLTITGKDADWFANLRGNTVYSKTSNRYAEFLENILFTHWGLSGPAVLQISSYWKPGETFIIDLLPNRNVKEMIADERIKGGRLLLGQLLQPCFSKKLIEALQQYLPLEKKIASLSKQDALGAADFLHRFEVKPAGDKGYEKAEVMRGGVDTRDLASDSLEALDRKGMFFGGECVDITGWLGGYNFQWAWASGYLIAQKL